MVGPAQTSVDPILSGRPEVGLDQHISALYPFWTSRSEVVRPITPALESEGNKGLLPDHNNVLGHSVAANLDPVGVQAMESVNLWTTTKNGRKWVQSVIVRDLILG